MLVVRGWCSVISVGVWVFIFLENFWKEIRGNGLNKFLRELGVGVWGISCRVFFFWFIF